MADEDFVGRAEEVRDDADVGDVEDLGEAEGNPVSEGEAEADEAQFEAPLPAVVPLGHGRHDVEPAAL